LQDPPDITINEEKIFKWINNGAQPSESVYSLMKTKGIAIKEKKNGKK
jgi:ribosomal protein S16